MLPLADSYICLTTRTSVAGWIDHVPSLLNEPSFYDPSAMFDSFVNVDASSVATFIKLSNTDVNDIAAAVTAALSSDETPSCYRRLVR